MEFKKLFSNDEGVSPVIGVMLMIVVTVVLAAAVSAYSSNMETQESAPTATLQVDSASYNDGYIQLSHMGGDTLTKSSMDIEITSSSPSTSGYVNMSNVTTPDFVGPGDTMRIEFWQKDTQYITGAAFTGDDISQSVAIGEKFRISIIDTETGQTVASVRPTLSP